MSVLAVAPVGALADDLAAGAPDALSALAAAHARDAADLLIVGLGDLTCPGRRERSVGADPFTLAVSRHGTVPRWGVLAVAALTRDHPYNLARRTLAAWHLSGGRVGVILVADNPAIVTAGRDPWLHPVAPDDSARLDDAATALRALWASWPAGTIVGERTTGVYARTEQIRPIDHDGIYRIAGPLTTPAAPGGDPVLATWVTADGVAPAWADLEVSTSHLHRGGGRIGDVHVVATTEELNAIPARAVAASTSLRSLAGSAEVTAS